MSTQAASTEVFEPVRYAVTAPLSADQAFALFTQGYIGGPGGWPGILDNYAKVAAEG
jgi:hypothetical protein